MSGQRNPKSGQGDGAGFGRLRAEQHKRAAFQHLIRRSHPSGEIYLDKIYEYAGMQIACYRLSQPGFEQARVAVFGNNDGMWVKDNDIIVSIEDR